MCIDDDPPCQLVGISQDKSIDGEFWPLPESAEKVPPVVLCGVRSTTGAHLDSLTFVFKSGLEVAIGDPTGGGPHKNMQLELDWKRGEHIVMVQTGRHHPGDMLGDGVIFHTSQGRIFTIRGGHFKKEPLTRFTASEGQQIIGICEKLSGIIRAKAPVPSSG